MLRARAKDERHTRLSRLVVLVHALRLVLRIIGVRCYVMLDADYRV